MNRQEYFEFHASMCERMTATTKSKNADYCGNGGELNPFFNFTQVEKIGICTTEQGFLTRMMDKLCRINSFAQKGFLEVQDESVIDTLIDLANYSILFAGYLKGKLDNAPEPK